LSGLRVALLNPWFWPEVQRGSERLVHDLAADLVKLGHAPRVITTRRGLRPPQRTVEDGFAVVRLPRIPERLWRKRGGQEGVGHQPFALAELLRGDDDVVNAHFPSDALAALAWRRRTGRPVVFSYGGVPQRNVLSDKRLKLQIIERATTESDAVTVGSRAARDAMWRWLGVEAEVVHPGVDLERFTPGGERAEAPTIACAADPNDDRKRVGLLVEAFALVRREHPGARLRLMGPAQPRFAADGVEFYDPDPHAIADVYREAWASGLASYNEAFGLVLVESLACGTPVFGMDDGGVPEIVDRPEVGRLFSGDAPADVARAILEALELARDPATAGACRARAEAFSTLATARGYEAVYTRLTARTSGA
jgi:glycosyltransferase involved in cell wall biosynthesis